MIPSDMTPPPVTTQATIQSDLKAEYERGIKEGRRTAILSMLQAMKCESDRHPPECGCDDEYRRMEKRLTVDASFAVNKCP